MAATPRLRPSVRIRASPCPLVPRSISAPPVTTVSAVWSAAFWQASPACCNRNWIAPWSNPEGSPARGAPLYRWLHYVDGRSETPRRIQIVMPQDADIDAGKVSILSHVGAGLIGLAEGRTIAWTDPSGAERRLTLVRIEEPGEDG